LAEASTLVAEGWHYRLWAVYPPEKVKPEDVLPTTRKSQRVDLSLAKGEYEPLLLVVRTSVPWRQVKPTFTDLRRDDGKTIPATELTFRRVAYVYVDAPSGAGIPYPLLFDVGAGLYPDPLPEGEGTARPNRNLCFWIVVHVPRTAAAGTYTGEATLDFRRESWMPKELPSPRLQFRVQVRRFALPENNPLRNVAHFNPLALPADWRTKEWLRAFCEEFASHYQTPDPLLPAPKLTLLPSGEVAVIFKFQVHTGGGARLHINRIHNPPAPAESSRPPIREFPH
jgi:hypothetical protein